MEYSGYKIAGYGIKSCCPGTFSGTMASIVNLCGKLQNTLPCIFRYFVRRCLDSAL